VFKAEKAATAHEQRLKAPVNAGCGGGPAITPYSGKRNKSIKEVRAMKITIKNASRTKNLWRVSKK